jgi:hypothetical protein
MRMRDEEFRLQEEYVGKAAGHAGPDEMIRTGCKTSRTCCKPSMIGCRTSRRVCGADRIGCRTIIIGPRKSKKCCRTSTGEKD